MKENKISEKIKQFAKRKWGDFTEWFTDKEHPRSRLNKNVFFHDSLKLIGLILVFLIIYSNLDKINQIVLIFIKLGSLLQLVLLFFILRKAWHLTINIKYAFRGLNHGTKAIIAILIVLLLFMAFLNQDKVVNSITQTYEEANFSKLNPIQVSGNFSLENFSFFGKSSIIKNIQCQEDFNNDIKKLNVKEPRTKVSTIEKKSFQDINTALEYVYSWDADNEKNTIDFIKTNLNSGQQIDLILYRMEEEVCLFGFCSESDKITYSELKFAVCNGNEARYPASPLQDTFGGFLG